MAPTTSINLRSPLTEKQKDYLVTKTLSTQKRLFATPFRLPIDPQTPAAPAHPADVQNPTNLTTMLANLLDDKYPSAQAYRDDFQLIEDNCKKQHERNHHIVRAAKQMLAHVDKFMAKIPRPKPPKKPIDWTEQMWREWKYVQRQIAAFRDGVQWNEHKKARNLVLEKIELIGEERLKKKQKQADSARKAGALSGPVGGGENVGAESQGGDQVEDIVHQAGDNRAIEKAVEAANEDGVGKKMLSPEIENKDDKDMDVGEQEDKQEGKQVDDQEHEHEHDGLFGEEEEEEEDTANSEDGSSTAATQKGKRLTIRDYDKALRELPMEPLTQEQINRLMQSQEGRPNFLGRTASLTRGFKFGQYHRKTNGFTSQEILLPSADARDERYCSHRRFIDLSTGEIIYMIGNHLIWKDLCGDEVLSYSKDPLFLYVHALRRYHEKQGDVTIQIFDCREVKSYDGSPATFYNALDIYTAFDVPKWRGWGSANASKLHPRKFTQEFLTHGPVFNPDSGFKAACIEHLIRDGLFEIFPAFHTAPNHKRAGLYTLQVVLRKIGYPPRASEAGGSSSPIYSYKDCPRVMPMTQKLLEIVQKVAMNYRKVPEGTDPSTLEPPLHAFISLLTFEKRQLGDPIYKEWIREHYTAQDVLDLYTDPEGAPLPGVTSVVDNLPGYMQYLDLVRDCIEVFSLVALPPNVVETAHAFDGTMDRSYAYAAYDDKQHRYDEKETEYHPTDKQKEREKQWKKLQDKRMGTDTGTGKKTETETSTDAVASGVVDNTVDTLMGDEGSELVIDGQEPSGGDAPENDTTDTAMEDAEAEGLVIESFGEDLALQDIDVNGAELGDALAPTSTDGATGQLMNVA